MSRTDSRIKPCDGDQVLANHPFKRLPDGSRRIRAAVREKGRRSHIQQWLELREIRVHVGRQGFRQQELRLWTSLLSRRGAPAMGLGDNVRFSLRLNFYLVRSAAPGNYEMGLPSWKVR